MRENICTIPISDVFAPKDGCPMCRMEAMLEKNYVEYITGAAMMEPDIRTDTNNMGFCYKHFNMMVHHGKRLPNALILDTHLEKIINELIPKDVKGKPDKKKLAKLDEIQHSCYVCNKMQWGMQHLMESLFRTWEKEDEFKQLYSQQPFICMKHYTMLMKSASTKGGISSKNLPEFYKVTSELTGSYLESLKKDIAHFCTMFDYRANGQDWGTSKDAIERSVEFLTSEKISEDSPFNEA